MNFCGRIAASAILLCIPAVMPAHAQQSETVPLEAVVVTGKLPNGFTYYIRKNNYPEKRATLYLVNKVGSVLETEQQRGLAHFLEHMAFNGTKHYPKNELISYLQKAGVRFGADLNATTSFDETIYQLPVGVEDKTLFRNAMQIMRDWAQDITLEGEEIDKERGVILEEKRQRLGAGQRVQDKVLPVITNHSVYANRLPIGTEEVLKNFKHEEIRKFYQDWYRPDLQALIVVGDVNVKEVEKLIKNMFSNLRTPENAKPRTEAVISLKGNNNFLTVTDAELNKATLELSVKFPAMGMETREQFKEATARTLIGLMIGNRFNELQQQPDAPFLSAGYSVGAMLGNLDAFNGKVVFKPGAYEKGIKAWWMELERIKRYGFTEKELKKAALNFMSGINQTNKDRDKIQSDSYVREYVNHFTKKVGAPGIAYEAELYKGFTDTVTPAAIQHYLLPYLKTTDRDIIITASEKEAASLPSEATVLQWMQSVEQGAVTAYVDKKSEKTSIFREQITPGTITSERKLPELGITELVLSNGVKVLLKPTTLKKDEIMFTGYSPGGLSLVSDADFYNARMAAGMVGASGVADMDLQELRELLTGKHVSVSTSIGELSEGVSGGATAEDLELSLQLTYLYFTKPRKDAVAFNNMLEKARIDFNNPDQSPARIFNDTLSAVLAGYHFRRMNMPPEKLETLDADKALALYKERFANAADFSFTFVGSFEVEAIKPLLAKYLGALPATGKTEAANNLKLDYPDGRITRKVVKGKEPQATVMLIFSGPFDYSDANSVQVKALAGVMNIKLTERLREQEGGVYGVRVNASTRKLPSGEYAIFVNFICDPRNVEPLILAANSEIMKVKMEGALDEDISKYKAGERTTMERAFKENGFWLTYINGMVNNGEPLVLPDMKKRLAPVTGSSLQQSAVRYFNNANYIRIVQVPELN